MNSAPRNMLHELFSTMKEWSPESEQTINTFLTYGHDLFIKHVEKFRGTKIKVAKEDRKKIIYQADVFLGQKAADLGFVTTSDEAFIYFRLIDGIGNYHDILAHDFPGAKVYDSTKERFWQRIRYQLRKLLVFDIPRVNH
jgi:ClpP class serine protease